MQFLKILWVPILFVGIMWGVYLLDHFQDLNLYTYGIFPRKINYLSGILFSPFIHGSWEHLLSNTYPMLILGAALFYFYPKSAPYVLLYGVLMVGFWVWAFARSSHHVGASGVVYVLGAFLFTSGVLLRHKRMMGVSLLVVFLYGSLVWGVLPWEEKTSWESHLLGGIAGVVLAFWFREDLPQKKKYSWEEQDEEYEIEFWKMTPEQINAYYAEKKKASELNQEAFKIQYIFKAKKD